ncbi:MAG: hypothetical protein GWO04_25340, partial [Actinobacteria bacterium]|nr:hypothetical protein [Actinomycetota bacterium]
MGRLAFAALCCALVLAGCGGDDSCPGCLEDAGRADGGALDGGSVDPGADAFVADGGALDAFVPDASVADGFVPDAFMADGFVPDAFMADGGPPSGPCSGGTGDHTIVTGVQPGLPRILWTGSDYAIAHFGRAAAGAAFESFVGRVDAMGSVTTVPALVTPDDDELSIWVRLAQSDVGFGIVYLDDRGANRQAYFARLDAAGALVAGSEQQLSDPSETVDVHAIAY